MEATMRTYQITLPISDTAFLRHQSRKMGWSISSVRSPRANVSKVKMTEEEFREKLDYFRAQAEAGNYVEKRPDETMSQFLDRVCM